MDSSKSGRDQLKVKNGTTNNEELRYAKLYYEETIDAKQFKQLIGRVKKKK